MRTHIAFNTTRLNSIHWFLFFWASDKVAIKKKRKYNRAYCTSKSVCNNRFFLGVAITIVFILPRKIFCWFKWTEFNTVCILYDDMVVCLIVVCSSRILWKITSNQPKCIMSCQRHFTAKHTNYLTATNYICHQKRLNAICMWMQLPSHVQISWR